MGSSGRATLTNFIKLIAPATELYIDLFRQTKSKPIKVEAKRIIEKLWACFPSFCLKIEEENTLTKIIRPLHDSIKYNLIARDHILQGLIIIVSSIQNHLKKKKKFKQNLNIIGQVTETLLPTLFNI